MNKLLMLTTIVTMAGCSSPDYLELRTGLHQHSQIPSICLGTGMSSHLASKVAANAVWIGQKDFSWQAGYSNEFCMLNEESKTDRVFSVEGAYKFDL